MTNEIYLSGSKEIAAYIKEDHRQIKRLVKNEQLPAFKRSGKGPWKALVDDLNAWIKTQRDAYLK